MYDSPELRMRIIIPVNISTKISVPPIAVIVVADEAVDEAVVPEEDIKI